MIQNFTLAEAREWEGTTGLGIPGATTGYKIYTLTATGNERGSNTVVITRPPA